MPGQEDRLDHPLDQARIEGIRGNRIYTRLQFTDVDGRTHRYNFSRFMYRELDAFLAAVGAPPRPRKKPPITHGRSTAGPHGDHPAHHHG